MAYENKTEPLAPVKVYHRRIWGNFMSAMFLLMACLVLGVVGYKSTVPEFTWYDSVLNASMILSGMGPVIEPDITLSNTAKLFASFYALFSGVAFISTIGLMIAPIAHRFFHKLHLEEN